MKADCECPGGHAQPRSQNWNMLADKLSALVKMRSQVLTWDPKSAYQPRGLNELAC